MIPRVKICGITRLEDALAACAAGADALGFVFFEGSRRCVTLESAEAIIRRLPPFVTVTGLFVNAARETILETAGRCRLDAIQLHGDESPQACRDLPGRVIKALRVAGPEDLIGVERYPVQGLLLDAKVAGHYGGSGQPFDWSILAGFQPPVPWILAGGLDPENVADAVRRVQPYAVDVSSGVEAAPGIKDPAKMIGFVRRVREAAALFSRS
ncbi:Phosphoribosylanthranilate isomerase [Candidatus Magnetaquicoccaceae bacterium FCR-1]|uniref:N-(5'-phosphoribosyl)anthranilate isomerase n=1 Tax=Candidatus Magnetaquiglobus chichijimensis TaxID=3141448 RepID=A0ABQ0C7B6_9PROT